MATVARKIGGSERASVGRQRKPVDTSEYSGRMALRLRELREAKGLTPEELADKVGVDWRTIYTYESRKRKIDPDLYPALAKALGCKSPSDFFPPLK